MKRRTCFPIIALALVAILWGLMGATPANANFFPQQFEQACMAEAAGFALNCSANDIQVGRVFNIRPEDWQEGDLPERVECVLGEPVTFMADVEIITTAKNRYDYTIYLPEGDYSPQEYNTDNTCSVLIGMADNNPGENLEDPLFGGGDTCADISKPPGSHLYEDALITMECLDADGDGQAEFTYCSAWNNQADTEPVCDGTTATTPVPGTPSKCKCDAFDIDVFIRPEPPAISKSAGLPLTRPEPGGDYAFDISFKNESAASVFITGLIDHVDIGGEGTLYDTPLNLLGSTTLVDPTDPDTPEGVYLKDNSECVANFNDLTAGELLPGATFSCSFTVTIVDRDLPDDQSPELYKDVIKVVLADKNGDPVGDGTTCPAALGAGAGDNCSDIKTVDVTNVDPTITVTKTPSTKQVLEPGENVTFNVVVTSTSGNFDDPLTLTSLMDSDFGDLTAYPGSTCSTGALYLGTPYTCSFTAFISGNFGDPAHSNTVTAKAVDNENDEATAQGTAAVAINDVPSSIILIKIASPDEVLETGDDPTVFRDVDYTFTFSVDAAGVDAVTFNSLQDVVWINNGDPSAPIDLTGGCMVDTKNGSAITPTSLNGFTLLPGESASCTITMALQGNAGDVRHNTATIQGTDADGAPLQASSSEDVTFTDAPLDIAPAFALKARAFVRLTNGGVDTATISVLKIKGINLVAGAGVANQFEILDETPSYSYETGDGPYAFCAPGTVIAPGATYECAFTIKLYPGFTPATDDIAFSALGLDGLVVTLTDDDGSDITKTIGIEAYTVE